MSNLKSLEEYNIKQKMKLARYKNTPIDILDELLKEDAEIRVQIYNRKDFYKIKDLLINFNEEEYNFFEMSIIKKFQFNLTSFLQLKIITIIVVVMFIATFYIQSINKINFYEYKAMEITIKSFIQSMINLEEEQ